jgi:dihydrodipicolinate synthase/N-acetylneuraminate lyase
MKDSSGDTFRLKRLADSDPGTVYAGGDKILGQAKKIEGIAGFISALGNVWPSFCLRVWNGEADLESALQERVAKVKRAGGLRAMKAVLGMGFRLPMLAPPQDLVDSIPPRDKL